MAITGKVTGSENRWREERGVMIDLRKGETGAGWVEEGEVQD